MSRSICVGCLKSYVEGKLIYRRIETSSDPDEMQSEIDAFLSLTGGEEYHIQDYDGFPSLGEYASLKEIAQVEELFEDMDEDLVFAVFSYHGGALEESREMLNKYVGTFNNKTHMAEMLCEEYELIDFEEHQKEMFFKYFDAETFLREKDCEGWHFLYHRGEYHAFDVMWS
jgi:antirestriction protein